MHSNILVTTSSVGRFSISFSPLNNSHVILTGNEKLILFKLENNVDSFTITEAKHTTTTTFINHIWAPKNLLICSTADGKLLKFDSISLNFLGTMLTDVDTISSLELTRSHIIVATSKSKVYYFYFFMTKILSYMRFFG
jgi:hypothetical protein